MGTLTWDGTQLGLGIWTVNFASLLHPGGPELNSDFLSINSFPVNDHKEVSKIASYHLSFKFQHFPTSFYSTSQNSREIIALLTTCKASADFL